MKAQYKLGTLVKFTTARGDSTGEISGVLRTTGGFSYQMTDDPTFTPEADIVAAFRPITPRKTRTVTTKKRTKKTTETQLTQ